MDEVIHSLNDWGLLSIQESNKPNVVIQYSSTKEPQHHKLVRVLCIEDGVGPCLINNMPSHLLTLNFKIAMIISLMKLSNLAWSTDCYQHGQVSTVGVVGCCCQIKHQKS